MNITIIAIGRLKAGPERDLVARYLDRLAKAGPAVGMEFSGVVVGIFSVIYDLILPFARETSIIPMQAAQPGG